MFDKWLSDEEAIKYLSGSEKDNPNYLDYVSKFTNFNKLLFEKEEIYKVCFKYLHSKNEKVYFKKFANEDAFKHYCCNREIYFFPDLALPRLGAIYSANFDFTHILYYKKDLFLSRDGFEIFNELAAKSGLYILK